MRTAFGQKDGWTNGFRIDSIMILKSKYGSVPLPSPCGAG